MKIIMLLLLSFSVFASEEGRVNPLYKSIIACDQSEVLQKIHGNQNYFKADSDGKTPLHVAAASSTPNIFWCLLIKYKAEKKILRQSNNGNTIWHELVTSMLSDQSFSEKADHLFFISTIVLKPYKVAAVNFLNKRNILGQTPLQIAASLGLPKRVEKLLRLGATDDKEMLIRTVKDAGGGYFANIIKLKRLPLSERHQYIKRRLSTDRETISLIESDIKPAAFTDESINYQTTSEVEQQVKRVRL